MAETISTTSAGFHLGAVALACGLALAIGPADVSAQQGVGPDDVDRNQTNPDLRPDVDDQTGLDDEDDRPPESEESAFESFDDVEVRHVQPDEIPDYKPGLPDGASSTRSADNLPRTLSGEQLTRVSDHVAASTLEIIAVNTPPEPYRSTEMIFRGHALWVSSSDTGTQPVLISTFDWLEQADRIYAVDGDVSKALSEGGLKLGGHESQPLDDFRTDTGDLVERNRANLVRLVVDESNPHLNLARLREADGEQLHHPTYGMVVYPLEEAMPDAIFGFSPAIASTVTPVGYANSDNLETKYSFYFLVHFGAILSAPIVGTEGRLLGISALRYPSDTEKSLAIPPGAIHAFLGTQDAESGDDD